MHSSAANSRLVNIDNDQAAFRWKDYRHHDKAKVMTLTADEFIRRFLPHTLPDGFHRIRHYGFLANGHRAARLALCRRLLAAPTPRPIPPAADYREQYLRLSGRSLDVCPSCGGLMKNLGAIPPHAIPLSRSIKFPVFPWALPPLDEVLAQSDFVVIACFLDERTRHLIDAFHIALMKPSAFLINVARGPLTDEAGLIAALEAGTLRASPRPSASRRGARPDQIALYVDHSDRRAFEFSARRSSDRRQSVS